MMRKRVIRWLWSRIPEADRQAAVGTWITNRARRRAAAGPFGRTFEDEVNNAGVDVVRDFNRATF